MSENPIHQCKRGFIITQDNDGNYVPFFIKVRDDDIVWKNSDNNQTFKNLKGTLKTYGYEFSSELQNPSPELHIVCDKWNFYIREDYSFRATYAAIPDKSNYIADYISPDKSTLSGAHIYINIPIPTLQDIIVIGNISPSIGSSIISYTPFRKRSYHPSDSFDYINISLSSSFQPNVIAEYNNKIISDLLNGDITPRINLYIEGTLHH